jgi:uncharacterized OB-fold protein
MPPVPTELPTVDWAGPGDPQYLLRPSPDAEPFHAALADNRLILRTCASCSRARYPHAPVCPYCGSPEYVWQEVVTGARLLTWGRCHLGLVPEFPPPYLVACALLDAGPPMIGALLGPGAAEPRPGDRLTVVAQRWPSGVHVAAFVAEGTSRRTNAGSTPSMSGANT